MVYNVNGGFEDWAYGGSWDKHNVTDYCEFSTNTTLTSRFKTSKDKHKSYDIDAKQNIKISYNKDALKSLVFLVEAGYDKIPKQDTLGNELYFY